MNKNLVITPIVLAIMPIILSIGVGNAINCEDMIKGADPVKYLKDHGYTMEQGLKSCNQIHPFLYYLIIPLSPVIWYTQFRFIKASIKQEEKN